MKTPLEKAYDKLRGLDIEYNSELLTIMSNLASEAFSVGYNKAVKNTQEVYKKVYELLKQRICIVIVVVQKHLI